MIPQKLSAEPRPDEYLNDGAQRHPRLICVGSRSRDRTRASAGANGDRLPHMASWPVLFINGITIPESELTSRAVLYRVIRHCLLLLERIPDNSGEATTAAAG